MNEKTYYTCAETAKFVREALKKAFPKQQFSVTSKTYSGGASINVRWTDGYTTQEIDSVVKQYEGATFDGMIDLKSYVTHTDESGQEIHYGADYIFTNRDHSRELVQKLAADVAQFFNMPLPEMNQWNWYAEGIALPGSGHRDTFVDVLRQAMSHYNAVTDAYVVEDSRYCHGWIDLIIDQQQAATTPTPTPEPAHVEPDGTDSYMIENQRGVKPGEDWLKPAQAAAAPSTTESSLPPCTLCRGETVAPVAERGVCDSCLEKMQAYSDRVQARVKRLREYAEKIERQGRAEHDRAHQMADIIPFGQPILVGHHSERRDRNYRERIHNTFGRAFAKLERAAELERRADRAEKNRAISSDDPAAILKLQEKLTELEQFQEQAKRINKAVRAVLKQSDDKDTQIELLMKETGIQYKTAESALTPDYMGRYGVPDYALTNNNGNMRRVKLRIMELQNRAEQANAPDLVREEQHGAIRLERDPEENRLRLHFPGKPAPAIIAELKSRGFRWSPTNKAWQRQLNNGAEYAARCVIEFAHKHS